MKSILWFLIFNVVDSFSSDRPFQEWRNRTKLALNYFITTEAEMFERWLDNDEMINEHNTQNHSWKMSHNQFSHFSPKEFAEQLLHHFHPIKPMMFNAFRDRYFLNESEMREPKKVDWRTKGVVGAIRNQQQCGSCFAFSAVEAVESLYAINTSKLVNMSVQQIVSCDTKDGNAGCKGGIMDPVFSFIKNNGLRSDEDYPYTSGKGDDGECLEVFIGSNALKPGWVTGFKDIPHGREDLLRLAVAQQPVSVAVDATFFQFYSSGIYSSEMCSKEHLNHAVVLVGYDKGEGFYWLRNSWGTGWAAENGGYMKIKMGTNECGLAMSASIPTH